MSIRWKLILGFLTIALLGAAQGLYLSSNTKAMAALVDEVFDGPLTSVEHARAALQRFGDAERHVNSILTMTHVVDSGESVAAFDDMLRDFDRHMEKVASAARSEDARVALEAITAESRAWRQASSELIGSKGTTSIASPHTRRHLAAAMTEHLDQLVATTIDQARTMQAEAAEAAGSTQFWGLVMIAATGLLAGAIGLAIAQHLMDPLRKLGQRMTELAKGKIDDDVPFLQRRDEIGTMAKTIEVFRANAEEIQILNAQKESDAKSTAEAEREKRRQEDVILAEIVRLVEDVSAGNLTGRLATKGQHGLFKSLAEQLNVLVDRLDEVIGEINEQIAAMSTGDLTKRLHKEYGGTFGQLKANANSTAETLGRIVGDIQVVTQQVSSAAAAINTGTGDLAGRTEQAASNIEDTSASMEQMAATVKQNAGNAGNASRLAEDANGVAARGGEIVGHAVSAMAGIEESSRKIEDIIGVIDEIAFQTNLLALNASVEAARAGEAGKGFAVVASEVRALAQRSAGAAGDIKALIQHSCSQVKGGVELVNKTGETLEEIVMSIRQLSAITEEISASSREQSTGAEEINLSITRLDEMTKQNATLVEESTASARTLSTQAEKLAEMVAFFKFAPSNGSTETSPMGRIPTEAAVRHRHLDPV